MNKIELTIHELLYLSALAGANDFVGIPDGFYGMSDLEIRKKLLDVHESLERKGYAQTDFDGSFVVSETLEKIVAVCALCDKYIIVDRNTGRHRPKKIAYYFKDGEVVLIKKGGEEYLLEYVEGVAIWKNILNFANWIEPQATAQSDRIIVPQEAISRIMENSLDLLDNTVAMDVLCGFGCSKLQAKIIYEGICGSGNYIFILAEEKVKQKAVVSISVVRSENGTLELTSTKVDGKDVIEFRQITGRLFDERLNDILMQMLIEEDGKINHD